MARELRTPEELRKVANDAQEVADVLRDIADKIDAHPTLEGVLAHGGGPINVHLPKIWNWAMTLRAEYDENAKAADEGRMSIYEYDKRRNEPPRSPAKKKAVKKKKRKK